MIVPAIIFVKELVEFEQEKEERLDLEVRWMENKIREMWERRMMKNWVEEERVVIIRVKKYRISFISFIMFIKGWLGLMDGGAITNRTEVARWVVGVESRNPDWVSEWGWRKRSNLCCLVLCCCLCNCAVTYLPGGVTVSARLTPRSAISISYIPSHFLFLFYY